MASWIVTGYFTDEHFPPMDPMSYQQALETLDCTGMLRSMGIPSDLAGEPLSADRLGASCPESVD